MAAKALNQNDLVEIIRSNTQMVTDVSKAIFDAADPKQIYMSEKFESTMSAYVNVMEVIYGRKGLYSKLIGVFNHMFARIASLPKIGLIQVIQQKMTLRAAVTIIRDLMRFSSKITKIISDNTVKNAKNALNMKMIDSVFSSVTHIINQTRALELTPIDFIKLKWIRRYFTKLKVLLRALDDVLNTRGWNNKTLFINMLLVRLSVDMLKDIIDVINEIKIIKSSARISMLTRTMKPFTKFLRKLSEIALIPITPLTLYTLLMVKASVILLTDIFDIIIASKVSAFKLFVAKKRIRAIIKIIPHLNMLLWRLGHLKISTRAVVKLLLLEIALKNMAKALASLLLIAPIMGLVVLLSPILILGFWALAKIFNVLGIIARRSLKARAVIGILYMGLLINIILLMGAKIGLLVLLGLTLWKGMKALIVFLSTLIVVFSLVLLIGLLAIAAMPLMDLSIVGLDVMAVSVAMITLIALELLLLQNIRIDQNAVKNNVHIVIDTCKDIIRGLFEEEEVNENTEDNVFKKFFRSVFKGIGMIVEAALSSAIFVMTFVSVTMIILVASQLSLLAKIKLDRGTISENVSMVVGTARYIIDTLFATEEEKEKHESKGWFSRMITHVFTGIGDIIDGILAVAFLATTFVSIAMIMLIALELKLLMKVKLDTATIKENVTSIMSTAREIITTIFAPEAEKEDASQKGWFSKFINWAFPHLAPIIDGILAIAYLSTTMIAIGMLTLIAKNLKTIQGFDIDVSAVTLKTQQIISTAKAVISAVTAPIETNEKQGKGFLRKLLEFVLPDNLTAIIDGLMAIGFLATSVACVGMLAKIAENLVTIQKTPDLTGISTKTQTIISTAKTVISAALAQGKSEVEIDSSTESKLRTLISATDLVYDLANKCNQLNTISIDGTQKGELIAGSIVRMTEKISDIATISGVENSIRLLDNYGKFIDKVNGVNVENIKQTTSMFEQMARFSESIAGNFDGLAESLNEKIMPLIEELKGLMEKLPGQIEVASAKTTNAIQNMQDTVSGKTPTRNEIAAQVKAEQPSLTGAELQAEIDRRIRTQVSNMSNSIVSKLDEIKRMFTEGTAKVATT